MAQCKTCGAEIIWTITERGKKMPVDVSPAKDGNVLLKQLFDPEDGKEKWYATVLRGEAGEIHRASPGAPAYTSHFKTCPDAKEHRSPRPRKGVDFRLF
jgi:hypothetical protein